MPISEKTRNALRSFGLTDYEARVYVSLLERGVMTARETSEAATVPYSKMYEVLASLERKGWLESERARPSRYYPRPPSLALETNKLRIESSLERDEKQALQELAPIYERRDVQERPEIWIVRGEYNILSKMREMLLKSEVELLIAVPTISQIMLQKFSPILASLKDRGVKTTVMTTRGVSKQTLDELSEFCDVRTRDQMFGGGVISDAREVILLLGEERNVDSNLAIWSDHPGLASFAKNYFEYLWQTAKVRQKLRKN